MKALASVRDDRAAPMFGYIISHVDHTGEFLPVYLGAIEALGSLKSPAASSRSARRCTGANGGRPGGRRRCARRRRLPCPRIATPEALDVLEQALSTGSARRPLGRATSHDILRRSRQKPR